MVKVEGQLTLEELVNLLEQCDDKAYVSYDWEPAMPDIKGFCSYRGYYEDLALGVQTGYAAAESLKVAGLKRALQDAVGETFEGWKGGEYVCRRDTALWASYAGGASGYAIVGIKDEGWSVKLLTKKEEE